MKIIQFNKQGRRVKSQTQFFVPKRHLVAANDNCGEQSILTEKLLTQPANQQEGPYKITEPNKDDKEDGLDRSA